MKETLRILLAGMSVLLLSFIISPSVDAHEGSTYGVGTSSLNVRSGPTDNAPIVGSLHPGDQVVVFEEHYGWAQTYYGGKEAWVASQFLYPLSSTEQIKQQVSVNKSITVNEAGVHVRSGPGTDYSIIGLATAGDTYEKIATKGDWHKILLDDGSTGWIAAWLTDGYTAENSTDESLKITPKSNTNGSLAGINIVLDPGHGGNDPGAIGFKGVVEKNLTLSTAEVVASSLRKAGATVKVTRQSDQYVSLEKRVLFSNKFQTDAFISLHYNAYPFIAVNGIGTYYYENGRGLASSIQSAIGKQVKLNDRGIHFGNYHVLRENSDLAVLIELGFITNPNDLFTIQTSEYQNNVAQAVTTGVKNYFLD
ncbi:N-acetylmuramoyl-L-alanine amidase [Virgibacillus phasianinus]|uniref:N-acetylmuramoyl-L-alanine amidase n=1 Tax=Virgibacillus phasianinus TaxID=2017483 RepID=A0A220U202_9BACI|nr:N-acetylmuramoyl-L-alanine amidase [Virgibacillus phasianinus]ASK61966.1 N-acetylmuramoyl-L-alanine amidase [Virgibacillus phasianinus]